MDMLVTLVGAVGLAAIAAYVLWRWRVRAMIPLAIVGILTSLYILWILNRP